MGVKSSEKSKVKECLMFEAEHGKVYMLENSHWVALTTKYYFDDASYYHVVNHEAASFILDLLESVFPLALRIKNKYSLSRRPPWGQQVAKLRPPKERHSQPKSSPKSVPFPNTGHQCKRVRIHKQLTAPGQERSTRSLTRTK